MKTHTSDAQHRGAHTPDGGSRSERAAAVDALRDLNFAVQAFREAVADYFSLGVRESQAAAHLVTHGQLSAGELSRLLDLTPGTITHLLGRLERAGLATTGTDPTDQRRHIVAPTSRAHIMIDEVRTWLDSCLDSFDNSTIPLAVVIDVTTTLRDALTAARASLRSSTGPAT